MLASSLKLASSLSRCAGRPTSRPHHHGPVLTTLPFGCLQSFVWVHWLSFKGVKDGTRRFALLPEVCILSTSVSLRIGKIKLAPVGTGADGFFLPQHEEQRIEEFLCN